MTTKLNWQSRFPSGRTRAAALPNNRRGVQRRLKVYYIGRVQSWAIALQYKRDGRWCDLIPLHIGERHSYNLIYRAAEFAMEAAELFWETYQNTDVVLADSDQPR